ncbi:hypothetical protein PPH41_44485 [Burkholderia gladioli]|nr:hypothetical protein [Burkholderia gladioli]
MPPSAAPAPPLFTAPDRATLDRRVAEALRALEFGPALTDL